MNDELAATMDAAMSQANIMAMRQEMTKLAGQLFVDRVRLAVSQGGVHPAPEDIRLIVESVLGDVNIFMAALHNQPFATPTAPRE